MMDSGEILEQKERILKPGLTYRSALALVFASLVIMPVQLYLILVSGANIASAAVYITVILFTELSFLGGSPLTKQEIFIVYTLAGLAASNPVFIAFVQRKYLVTSPFSWSFIDPFTRKPLPEVIPWWYVPPYNAPSTAIRSFFHPDWVIPMVLSTFQFGVLYIIEEIALTMMLAQYAIEVENLPFPLAQVNSQMIITLTERPKEKMSIFAITATLSGAYALFLYGIPILMFAAFGVSMQLIPFPWIDLTTGYFGVEKIMPGAAYGIATDALAWVTGFILPLNLLVCQFISSIAVWVFGSWLALTYFRGIFPTWAEEWKKGMSLQLVVQRATLRVWVYPQVGIIIALAALTIVFKYKSIIKAFKIFIHPPASIKASGYLSFKTSMLMYFGATSLSIVVFHLFVPDFPIWIAALFSIGLTFFIGIANTRMLGEAATTLTADLAGYLWYGSVLLVGYPKVDAMLFSPVIGGGSAAGWVQNIKTAYLTETKPIDFFKAYVIAVILYHIFSIIYVSFMWAIAPIPSSVYPATTIYWPITVINQGMFLTRQITGKPFLIAGSAALFFILGVVGNILNKIGIPFNIVGLATGTLTLPPFATSSLIGGIIGKYVLQRYIGKEKWNENKAVIVAGVALGEGIIVGIFSAFTMMSKSTWLLPY